MIRQFFGGFEMPALIVLWARRRASFSPAGALHFKHGRALKFPLNSNLYTQPIAEAVASFPSNPKTTTTMMMM